MKIIKTLVICVLLLSTGVLFACSGSDSNTGSHEVTPVQKDIKVSEISKSIYPVTFVDDICGAAIRDIERAEEEYESKHVGLIGVVESIAENQKSFTMKESHDSLSVSCSSGNKDTRAFIENLSVGEKVVICGTVNNIGEDIIELEADSLNLAQFPDDTFRDGYLTVDADLYSYAELKDNTLGTITYYSPKRWSGESITFYEEADGIDYDLGNGERLLIYDLQWDKAHNDARAASDKSDIKWWAFETEYVEDYLTAQIVPHRMEYSRTSEETDYIKFDYYGGHTQNSEQDPLYRQAEIYYHKAGSRMIVVAYIYGRYTSEPENVAFLISTLSVKE